MQIHYQPRPTNCSLPIKTHELPNPNLKEKYTNSKSKKNPNNKTQKSPHANPKPLLFQRTSFHSDVIQSQFNGQNSDLHKCKIKSFKALVP